MFKILVLLAVSLPFVFAQSGTVKAGGQPIPGATVRATQGERSLVTLTDDNGAFRFDGMTPGAWVIEADMFGFDHLRREVQVAATPTNLDLTLQLATRARSLAAPGRPGGAIPPDQRSSEFPGIPARCGDAVAEFTPQVSADSSNESFLVNGTVSEALRTNQADFAGIWPRRLRLSRRFSWRRASWRSGPVWRPWRLPVETSRRGRCRRSRWTRRRRTGVDEAAAEAEAAVAALREAAARWRRRWLCRRWRLRRRRGGGGGGRGGPGGRGGRGGQNAAFIGNRARRSANTIRAQVFFTARNSVFDARPFSLNGQEQAKSSYANNRYGLNIGGPVIIPKLFDASKILNFTVNYNGTLSRNPYDATATLPSAAERSGNFAGRNTIYDPSFLCRGSGLPAVCGQPDPADPHQSHRARIASSTSRCRYTAA